MVQEEGENIHQDVDIQGCSSHHIVVWLCDLGFICDHVEALIGLQYVVSACASGCVEVRAEKEHCTALEGRVEVISGRSRMLNRRGSKHISISSCIIVIPYSYIRRHFRGICFRE